MILLRNFQVDSKRKYVYLILLLMLGLAGFCNSSQAAVLHSDIGAKAAILIDAKTGQVITSQNERQRLPIASISKLLVIYMVEQKIQQGTLKHNQPVTISKAVARFSQNTKIANVPMTSKKHYTVHQLEMAALLPSSNAAAMALAELVAGSQTAYYRQAVGLLKQWGIKNVHIYSASGLRDGDLGHFNQAKVADRSENKLSACEVAIVARQLVQHFPGVLKMTQQSQSYFPGITGHETAIKSTDELLANSNYHVQGLKTGTTAHSGMNFTGYATIKGQPVISVVLNDSIGHNFTDTEALFDQAAQQTHLVKLAPTQAVTVINAKTKKGLVALKTQHPVTVFTHSNAKPVLTSQPKLVTNIVKAPLRENQLMEKQTVQFSNVALNDFVGTKPKLHYVTKNSVEKTNFLVTAFRHLKK